MHEQSETASTDNGYINLYGHEVERQAGQPLPLMYGFEKPQYQSLMEALQAASVRSNLAGMPDAGGRGGTAALGGYGRPSSSDYLRQQPSPDILRLLQILWQIRSSMNTGP